MNQHLKQAIAAARAGKKPQAKVLLARVIKDEPENVNAWFLLSNLADTEEQKIQHLQKVLELQPDHPAAAEQLAELIPAVPESAEESFHAVFADTSEYTAAAESEPEPEIFPLPEIDLPAADVPDDPDEAMAWLERLAADQGAPLDELPSMSQETAEPESVFEPIDFDFPELEAEMDSDIPSDPDEAMAWLDQLAAEPGASLDELPTMLDSDESDEDLLDSEDTFSWLDDEDLDFLGTTATQIEQSTFETEQEEQAKTLKISKDYDFVSQSKGDSIPAWLAGEEDFIAAETVLTGSPAIEEAEAQPEPENLPDWLNDESLRDWEGEEGRKSGQVVWKAGESDESLKPTPPAAARKETKAAARQKAAAGSNNLYLTLLVLAAIILIGAILALLIFQPL